MTLSSIMVSHSIMCLTISHSSLILLTCAAESITLVSSVTRAGVAPLSVVACCIGMAAVSLQ